MTAMNSKGLPCPKGAADLLDMYFLDIRSHLLEAAAALDRIERAAGSGEALNDSRLKKVERALEIMGERGGERARRFLELFSDVEA